MRDITRAQAIELLKSLRFEDDETCSENRAVDMAIASLETDEAYDLMYEQPEWCKDCISREQAIKEFCKQTCETPNCRFRDKGIAHASCDEVDVLKRLPSVLPKATKNDLGVASGLEKNSKKLEKDFGELDCISRAEVLKLMQDNWHTHNGDWAMEESMDDIRALPAVTPQEPRCKDCKWWKDSDGEYRRGCGAESQCPINRKEVYEGNGYCFLYEPQESEDK